MIVSIGMLRRARARWAAMSQDERDREIAYHQRQDRIYQRQDRIFAIWLGFMVVAAVVFLGWMIWQTH